MRKLLIFLTIIVLIAIIFIAINNINIPSPTKLNIYNLPINNFI